MGFFSRIFNVGKSHVNAALDSMEDPAKLIDIQIDNARKSVGEYQKQVAAVMADHRLMAKKLQDAELEKTKWVEAAEKWSVDDVTKAEQCIAKAELLQKECVEYKKLVEQQAKVEEDMKLNLEAVRKKLQEAESARTQIKASAKRAEAKEKTSKILSKHSFDDTAFTALERLKAKADAIEANADAALELNTEKGVNLAKDINLLEGPTGSAESVNDRIKALKNPNANASLDSRIAALTAPKEKE